MLRGGHGRARGHALKVIGWVNWSGLATLLADLDHAVSAALRLLLKLG
jgi:hypothetical protein